MVNKTRFLPTWWLQSKDRVSRQISVQWNNSKYMFFERKKKKMVWAIVRIKGACRDKKQCLRGTENNFIWMRWEKSILGREVPKGRVPGRYKEWHLPCEGLECRRNGRKRGQICGVLMSMLRALIVPGLYKKKSVKEQCQVNISPIFNDNKLLS